MIIDNLRQIRDRVAAAARRAGRSPDSVSLLAVIKYAPLPAVEELLRCGQVTRVAESRVQDAQRRKAALGPLAQGLEWRLIGHLQTNKAKQAVETFDAVDSIDSLHVAQALDKRLEGTDRTLPVLVQVKLTQRETQSGTAPEEIPALLEALARLKRLRVNGLMGIAPQVEDPEKARPAFAGLKRLFDQHFAGRPGAQLSMGMSHDFEAAIEEGSTMIRIGSALFSPKSEASVIQQQGKEDRNDR